MGIRGKPQPRPFREVKDVLPGPGWQPKSDFFKAIWKQAEFKIMHPRMTLTCPHCHHDVVMMVSFPGDQ